MYTGASLEASISLLENWRASHICRTVEDKCKQISKLKDLVNREISAAHIIPH